MAAIKNNELLIKMDPSTRREVRRLTEAIERLNRLKEQEIKDRRALHGGAADAES